MSDTNPEPTPAGRRGTVAIIAALAVVIVAAVVIGVVSAQPAHRAAAAAPSSSAPTAGVGAGAAPSVSAVPSASSSAAFSAPAGASSAPAAVPLASAKAPSASPAPQPTKTASIARPATIVKALTAKVTKRAAVAGKAQGPGEIAGPAVQFTIRITNTTGSTVDLRSAVVNAYFGADDTPATQLEEPGGQPFPDSVRDGATATGVFVFTIPVAQRGSVSVTLDTSVANAVVAFKGPAPK